jgi:N-acyl-D-amino-acid deacylase
MIGVSNTRHGFAVDGNRIAAVGPLGAVGSGEIEHDLGGRTLSPGFIDAHNHDDSIVLDAPEMLPKISQEVTADVIGNCSISLAPVTFAGEPPTPMNLLVGGDVHRFPRFAACAVMLQIEARQEGLDIQIFEDPARTEQPAVAAAA